MFTDSDEDDTDKADIQTLINSLNSKMEDLNTCNDLIGKHGSALQRALTDIEQLEGGQELSSKIKMINERATMFRITSNAMINVSGLLYGLISIEWYRCWLADHSNIIQLKKKTKKLSHTIDRSEESFKLWTVPMHSINPYTIWIWMEMNDFT